MLSRRLSLSLGLLLLAVSSLRADYLVVRVIVDPDATSRTAAAASAGMLGATDTGAVGITGGNPGVGMMGASGQRPQPMGQMGAGMAGMGMAGKTGMTGTGMTGTGMTGTGMMGNTGGAKLPPPPTFQLRPDDYVIAVIPLKRSAKTTQGVFVAHKWTSGGEIAAKVYKAPDILVTPLKQVSPKRMYAQRMAGKEKDRDANWYHQIAGWCLELGLNEECEKSLDTLAKMVADKKGGNPEPVVLATVAAWNKLKDEMNLDSPKVDGVKLWKERTGYSATKASAHYAIVYEGGNEMLEESIKRRLSFLEQNFRTFYLLNAIQGRLLKLPEQKQVAIVSRDSNSFREQRVASDSTEVLTADGFFAQRDNAIFFSPRRTDGAWQNFAQRTKELFDRYGYANLLSGRPLADRSKRWDETAKEEIYRGQMYAMVEQALEEESEQASATQEGTRQLYIASGLLPKAVSLPGWLKFGLSAQQELTRAPFPTESKSKIGLWPSAGGPSWSWMKYYEDIKTTDRLGAPVKALTDTLAGRTFSDAASGIEPNPVAHKKPDKGPIEDEAYAKKMAQYAAEARAKTLSWSLVWYLTRNHSAQLSDFFAELSALPRDLEPDGDVLTLMFARSFKLTKASPAGEVPDPVLMSRFANNWVLWMGRQNSPGLVLNLEDPAQEGYEEGATPGVVPGSP